VRLILQAYGDDDRVFRVSCTTPTVPV